MNRELVRLAFSNYYRKEYVTLEDAIEFLWERNLVDVGELTELAITKQGKLKKESRGNKGFDFNDHSDSKYCTVNHYEKISYATIAGICNKIGPLRVMVYEPLTNKNYFFKIPHKVYKPFTLANDTIKVWFDAQGSPRNPKRNLRENLWNYQCTRQEWAN